MPAIQFNSWYRHWLALDDVREGQLDAWSGILRHLERRPGWFDLSDDARLEAEQASGLTEIDGRLRAIHRRLRRWLRYLPTTPSRDLEGVVANLKIAERLLLPEENAVVHGVIVRAARDLERISRKRCRSDKRLARTFLGNARAFHRPSHDEHDRPVGAQAYSLAITIELALKAYLLHCGLTDEWNRRHLGHDLNKALRCARMLDLQGIPEGLSGLTGVLNPLYASGALSRGIGETALPLAYGIAHHTVGDLLDAIQAAIGR